MRPTDVLQPILATVRNDPEYPGVEASTNFSEVLIRLDEAQLQDVFSDIRTPRHAQRMAIEWITVPRDQSFERVAIPAEHALDDELICIVQINHTLISSRGRFRRLHDNRVTHFPRFGQCARLATLLQKDRHVDQTKCWVGR